ncbi:MAG TPA: VacJ family lipoprotein [Thiolapillus brandeum]|uniref:VacJ family lipoprotein n=1 Tax=Thiolapillus brandeum TaxID=1076588 RepID=A0A831KCQ9_9GAMM|nr:VacJ family lipoprotein [Thiolapillus brandeum]
MLISGCATPAADNVDPWESFNRPVYKFNEKLDEYVATPLAQGYQAITPKPVDRGITRFFANLDDVQIALNNLLQFKLGNALSDVARFAVNSTLGILGFMDVATGMGLEKHEEDFGQTLGKWGFSSGPYLVLPVIGPSNVRDTFGFAGDWVVNPIYTQIDSATVSWSLYGIRYVDRRADLLKASRILESAALDPYSFVRDSYIQRRQHLVFDGNPPQQDDFFDE